MVGPAVGGGLKLNVTAVFSSALLCPTPLQMVAPVDGAAKVEPASDSSRKPLKLGVPVSVSVVSAVVERAAGAVTTYGSAENKKKAHASQHKLASARRVQQARARRNMQRQRSGAAIAGPAGRDTIRGARTARCRGRRRGPRSRRGGCCSRSRGRAAPAGWRPTAHDATRLYRDACQPPRRSRPTREQGRAHVAAGPQRRGQHARRCWRSCGVFAAQACLLRRPLRPFAAAGATRPARTRVQAATQAAARRQRRCCEAALGGAACADAARGRRGEWAQRKGRRLAATPNGRDPRLGGPSPPGGSGGARQRLAAAPGQRAQ